MAKVDFLYNQDDIRAALLGSLGFSTDYIMSRTKLTMSQVIYRLGKASIKRMDYRNGVSPIANIVFRQLHHRVHEQIQSQLLEAQKEKSRKSRRTG